MAKYRIMIKVPGQPCCGPEEWMTIGTTTDPAGFQALHPDWVIRFEKVKLGKIEIFAGR